MDDYPKTIEGLLQHIAELEKTILALQDENRQLREQLEQERRKNARQAAPFRRREHNKIPNDQKKRPGRKPGHIDEEIMPDQPHVIRLPRRRSCRCMRRVLICGNRPVA